MEKDKMSKEELMLKHNEMVIKILQQCDYIIENRYYLNETGIKNTVTEIKDIAKHFYIEEPQWRNYWRCKI